MILWSPYVTDITYGYLNGARVGVGCTKRGQREERDWGQAEREKPEREITERKKPIGRGETGRRRVKQRGTF